MSNTSDWSLNPLLLVLLWVRVLFLSPLKARQTKTWTFPRLKLDRPGSKDFSPPEARQTRSKDFPRLKLDRPEIRTCKESGVLFR